LLEDTTPKTHMHFGYTMLEEGWLVFCSRIGLDVMCMISITT